MPRTTLVLLLNGNWDCILLSIALANLQAHNSNAGPHARGSRGRVLFSSACILDMAAFCRLTRAEGRNRDPGSSMVRWLLQRTYLVQRAEQVAQRSAAWLRFLGSLRPTHVAPSFFRNRPFRRETCVKGQYSTVIGATSDVCQGCPMNSYGPEVSNRQTACTCHAGFSGFKVGSCTECTAGKYKNTMSNNASEACSANNFYPDAQSTISLACG